MKKNILIVGWVHEGSQFALHMARILRRFYNVCVCALEPTANVTSEVQYCFNSDPAYLQYRKWEKRIPLNHLINSFKKGFLDGVIFGQCSNFFYDLEGIDATIPLCYFIHEITQNIHSQHGIISQVLYGFGGAKRELNFQIPPEMQGAQWTFLPHPVDDTIFSMPLNYTRPLWLGFKGAVRMYNSPQPVFLDIVYKDRQRILDYAQKKHHCHIEFREYSYSDKEDWFYFTKQCNLSLNIPGCFDGEGWNNEREYMVMGLGSVLVQYYHRDWELTGLKPRENCLMFQSLEDLDRELLWAKSHPLELEQIRQKGYHLAKSKSWFGQRGILTKVVADLVHDRYDPNQDKMLSRFDEWYHRFQLYDGIPCLDPLSDVLLTSIENCIGRRMYFSPIEFIQSFLLEHKRDVDQEKEWQWAAQHTSNLLHRYEQQKKLRQIHTNLWEGL